MNEKNLKFIEAKMKEECSVSRKVGLLMRYLGLNQGIRGYDYVKEGVILGLSDHQYLYNIVKDLYGYIAEEYNTSISKVERCIRHLVESYFKNTENELINCYVFGNVFKNGEKMNCATFICSLVHFIEDLD